VKVGESIAMSEVIFADVIMRGRTWLRALKVKGTTWKVGGNPVKDTTAR